MITEINGKFKAICDKCGDELPTDFETEYAAEYAISQEGWSTVSGDDYKDYCIKCKEEINEYVCSSFQHYHFLFSVRSGFVWKV